jgi:transcriptional regulator with XRE-family HTH domain
MSAPVSKRQGFVPAITLGWRIQIAMDHAGLRSADLEEMFEVSRNTISRLLHDKTELKTYELKMIAIRCGVDADWLITGVPPKEPPAASEADPTIFAMRPAYVPLRDRSRSATMRSKLSHLPRAN